MTTHSFVVPQVRVADWTPEDDDILRGQRPFSMERMLRSERTELADCMTTPTLIDVWIDPWAGFESNGEDRLQTFAQAWIAFINYQLEEADAGMDLRAVY